MSVELDVAAIDEILAREATRVAAMVARDYDALDEILDDDLVYVHSSGHADNKASLLSMWHEPGRRVLAIDFRDRIVRACGADGRVIFGVARLDLLRPGNEHVEFNVLFTSVYARHDRAWKLMLWQATRAEE